MEMQFRRSGQRDERRRRVLIEETQAVVAVASTTSARSESSGMAPGRSPERYSPDALAERQPSLVALIPTRHWTLLVLSATILAAVAGLQALYGFVAMGHIAVPIESLPALDLGSRSSLGAWLASTLLVAAALTGTLAYYVRRHRLDDYRGRYRLWRWSALVLMLAAVDQVAGLQETVRTALLHVGGIPGYEPAQLIATGVVTVLASGFLIRLGIELWESRLASLHLGLAAGCYASVAVLQAGWLQRWGWPTGTACVFQVMTVSGLTLAGHFLLWLAIAFYARHVVRDASGLVVHSPRTPKKRKQPRHAAPQPAEQTVAEPDARRVRRPGKRVVRRDAAHEPTVDSPPPERARPAAETTVAAAKARQPAAAQIRAAQAPAGSVRPAATGERGAEDGQADDLSDGGRKLSKAERRRLRKQRRRDRQPDE